MTVGFYVDHILEKPSKQARSYYIYYIIFFQNPKEFVNPRKDQLLSQVYTDEITFTIYIDTQYNIIKVYINFVHAVYSKAKKKREKCSQITFPGFCGNT